MKGDQVPFSKSISAMKCLIYESKPDKKIQMMNAIKNVILE